MGSHLLDMNRLDEEFWVKYVHSRDCSTTADRKVRNTSSMPYNIRQGGRAYIFHYGYQESEKNDHTARPWNRPSFQSSARFYEDCKYPRETASWVTSQRSTCVAQELVKSAVCKSVWQAPIIVVKFMAIHVCSSMADH